MNTIHNLCRFVLFFNLTVVLSLSYVEPMLAQDTQEIEILVEEEPTLTFMEQPDASESNAETLVPSAEPTLIDLSPSAKIIGDIISDNIPDSCTSCTCVYPAACARCSPAGCYSGCVECVYTDRKHIPEVPNGEVEPALVRPPNPSPIDVEIE